MNIIKKLIEEIKAPFRKSSNWRIIKREDCKYLYVQYDEAGKVYSAYAASDDGAPPIGYKRIDIEEFRSVYKAMGIPSIEHAVLINK